MEGRKEEHFIINLLLLSLLSWVALGIALARQAVYHLSSNPSPGGTLLQRMVLGEV
jgi:hypothetical protein